jgi:hypothetical protein
MFGMIPRANPTPLARPAAVSSLNSLSCASVRECPLSNAGLRRTVSADGEDLPVPWHSLELVLAPIDEVEP